MKALSVRQPIDEIVTALERDGFGHWLAGFIDGEGCFYFHAQSRSFAKPHFQLKLRDDDCSILMECVARTGLGYIRSIRRRDRSKPQSVWLIVRRADCLSLVLLLDTFSLRAKKQRDYLIWRKAVFLWEKKRRRGKGKGMGRGSVGYEITDEMASLKAALENIRLYMAAA